MISTTEIKNNLLQKKVQKNYGNLAIFLPNATNQPNHAASVCDNPKVE